MSGRGGGIHPKKIVWTIMVVVVVMFFVLLSINQSIVVERSIPTYVKQGKMDIRNGSVVMVMGVVVVVVITIIRIVPRIVRQSWPKGTVMEWPRHGDTSPLRDDVFNLPMVAVLGIATIFIPNENVKIIVVVVKILTVFKRSYSTGYVPYVRTSASMIQ